MNKFVRRLCRARLLAPTLSGQSIRIGSGAPGTCARVHTKCTITIFRTSEQPTRRHLCTVTPPVQAPDAHQELTGDFLLSFTCKVRAYDLRLPYSLAGVFDAFRIEAH
jgi:hypothetical protein